MTEALDQRALITRYLLGVASAEECTAVEEQWFADDTGLELLLRAEDELIDDYVRGTLSPLERQLFETHFLCTEQRRQRLKMVESLVGVLADSESAQKPRSSSDPTIRGFAQLLNWLDPDREKAAEKYETIRHRLIQIFASRGLNNPEDWANETIDRVASKLDNFTGTYLGDPAIYFYGVARLIMREVRKRPADPLPAAILSDASAQAYSDQAYRCLEECLQQLPESNRELILQYYGSDERSKLARRRELAQSLGVSSNALRIKAAHLRRKLAACVEARLKSENDRVDAVARTRESA